MSQNIIGVQFEDVGKIYYFDASRYPELKTGDPIIVRTSRGLQLAKISQVNISEENLDLNSFKWVERPATPQDLLQRKQLELKEEETRARIHDYLNENGLSGVKIISVEYSLDGNRLFILLNSKSSINYNIQKMHADIQKMENGIHLECARSVPGMQQN